MFVKFYESNGSEPKPWCQAGTQRYLINGWLLPKMMAVSKES